MFYGVLIFRSDTPDFFCLFWEYNAAAETKNSKTKTTFFFSLENGLLYSSFQISSCSRTLIGIEKLAKTLFPVSEQTKDNQQNLSFRHAKPKLTSIFVLRHLTLLKKKNK